MLPLIHISASNDWALLDISLYLFTSVALIDNILHVAYFSAVFALKSLSSPDMIFKNFRLVATQRGVTLCKFFSEFLTQAPPLATIGENIYNHSTCFVHEIVRLRRYS